MPRFFIDYIPEESVVLAGNDGAHIARALRMKPGEPLVLCDCLGTDYHCVIEALHGNEVTVRVQGRCASVAEPSLAVTVYQGLPKADKLDAVVQKCVELGAVRVVPVLTERCVSRPDVATAEKKRGRWQKIAEEAAKQSGRGLLPQVGSLLPLAAALREAAAAGEALLFYEGGGAPLAGLVTAQTRVLGIFIGPEGGFSEQEVALAKGLGAKPATLGPRILRTETAPIAALAAIMALTGNFDLA